MIATRLFWTLRAWHARRQAIRQLSLLSDAMLRDIGLSRQDIARAVNGAMSPRAPGAVPGGTVASAPANGACACAE